MTGNGLSGARILIVDDEPLNVELLRQELEDLGYLIDTAGDGIAALERVAKAPPDLVLLDVIMPRLDGIETCRRLKADPATALIPVIIMTALTAVEDRVRGIRAGADDFLSKPVDDRELIARIETALRTKLAIDRTRHELESATDQLRALGRIDRDATILIVAAEPTEEQRVRALVDERGGHAVDGDDHLRWVFIDPDPAQHALCGAKAALAATSGAGVGAALESGSTLVSLTRVEGGHSQRWETSASGPAAEAAASLAWLAAPGQVVVGADAAQRLGGRLHLEPLVGSDASLIGDDVAGQGEPGDAVALPWPDDYHDLIDPLRAAWRVEGPVYLTRSLSGKSGARVYSVDVTTADYSGQAILKLDTAPNPEWNEQEEARRHVRAVELNQRYAEAHLPRVVHSLVHDGLAATLSSIAGGGLEYVVPWAHVDYERQVTSATRISRDLLGEWNRGYTLSALLEPCDVLTSWLGYRLDPREGRIARFVESTGVDPTAPSFIFDGRCFPNPYAVACGEARTPGRTALRAAWGAAHGDLHGFNVLMPASGEPEAYYMIDLAYFREDVPLFYDNAYFELAHLLHSRETATVRRWMQLLGSAHGRAVPTGDDYGLLRIIEAVRGGLGEWISEREPNRLAYMESQSWLARVAVGLNFVNKRVADQIKLLAFMYAALNLRSYLRFQGVSWPSVGPVLAV